MERKVGTVSRGIRCPIIREGDDLVKIVTGSVLEAAEAEGFAIRDRDVIAVTESVVARKCICEGAGQLCFHRGHRTGCEREAGRRDHRRYLPDSVQEPFCDLPARYCEGREEGSADAQLSQ